MQVCFLLKEKKKHEKPVLYEVISLTDLRNYSWQQA